MKGGKRPINGRHEVLEKGYARVQEGMKKGEKGRSEKTKKAVTAYGGPKNPVTPAGNPMYLAHGYFRFPGLVGRKRKGDQLKQLNEDLKHGPPVRYLGNGKTDRKREGVDQQDEKRGRSKAKSLAECRDDPRGKTAAKAGRLNKPLGVTQREGGKEGRNQHGVGSTQGGSAAREKD